jgi:hypothetical protein
MVTMTDEELLSEACRGFNARELETVLALMDPEVDWPNGMEGGRVHGHAGVREYWLRQWGMIDPHVEPRRFAQDEAGRTVIDVHQVVRDLQGKVLVDQVVQHIYTLWNGLILKMEIGDTLSAAE